jgi:hypothetical protein
MRSLVATLAVLLCALPAQAVVLGQVDTFQSGSMHNWEAYYGGGVEPSGGPGGTNDSYLRLTANNQPLLAGNHNQWQGDYIGTGVGAISANLQNFGPSPLEIRIFIAGGPSSVYASTQAFSLPADGQWHHAVFSLSQDDLTCVHPKMGDFQDNLGDAWSLTIQHQPGEPTYNWPSVSATLGIDNITALPEPASLALGLLGCALVCRRR